jgi:hypothetical protein
MELPDIPALATRTGEGPQRYPASLNDLTREALEALGEDYLQRTRIQRKQGRPFFIDKLPNNWLYTGFIHLILPNAKIIDARRHPLGCCLSNFKQFYARGQRFSQVTDFTVKSMRFWGVSEYIFGGSQAELSSNIIAIQVAIFRITPGNPEFPLAEGETSQQAIWTLSRSQFTQLATGNSVDIDGTLSPVFQMDAALSGAFQLAAGDYMITIGGVLDNAEGDAFAWVDGAFDGGNPATQAYGTRANQPGEWGRWIGLAQAPEPSASGAVMLFGQGTPVPGPAALALLGLAGRASRRRRTH